MSKHPTAILLWIDIPRMENVWFLGGGSGHGFKHGPALGELMADLFLKDGKPDGMAAGAAFEEKSSATRGTQGEAVTVKPRALGGGRY